MSGFERHPVTLSDVLFTLKMVIVLAVTWLPWVLLCVWIL